MDSNPRSTKRLLPIELDVHKPRAMSTAHILQSEPGKATITIEVTGEGADIIVQYLEMDTPIGMRFYGLPVPERGTPIKESYDS